jgi:hypothetical protein
MTAEATPARQPEYGAATGSTHLVLTRLWAGNLRNKARLIRKGVPCMDESLDDLARIMEEYVAGMSNAPRQSAERSGASLGADVGG